MTPGFAVELCRNALKAAFWISLPLLAIGFAAGIIVSLVQTITSMQDSSFGAVPRLAAFLVGLRAVLPWMLSRSIAYTTALFSDLGRYAR